MRRYPYVLLGICSGLTLAAKQDIVPMLAAVYLALALTPIWKKEAIRIIVINFLYLSLATSLAFAFFLAFMPVFWGWWESVLALIGLVTMLFQLPVWKIDQKAKPLALAGCFLLIGMSIVSPTLWGKLLNPVTNMVETREAMIGGQLDDPGDKNLFNPNTAKKRLTFLLKTTLTSNVMYSEVSSFDIPPFHKQIEAYEASRLSGRTGSPLADGLVVLLAVIGVWALLRQFNAEGLLICSMLITTAVLLFVMVPLYWQRYFLIMQIPYSLIAGVGANQIWIWGKEFIQANQKEKLHI